MSIGFSIAAFMLMMVELQQRLYGQQSPKYWSFVGKHSQSQFYKMCIEDCDFLPKDLASLP